MTDSQALPPQDTDTERALLGALFFTPRAIVYTKNGGISADSFYQPTNSAIYSAMYELYEEEGGFNQITLAAKLNEQGLLDAIGGEMALVNLLTSIDNTAMIKQYIQILREKELLRKEHLLFSSLRQKTLYNGEDGLEIIESAVESIKELQDEFACGKHSLTEKIKSFIDATTGVFTISEISRYLAKNTLATPKNITTVLQKLRADGYIARVGDRHGHFRKVEDDCPVLDLKNLDDRKLDIKWPFELEKYVYTMPGNIVVIAGVSNAGKTRFCLNTAKMNMDKFDIHYFSSEMGGREIVKTLRQYDGLNPFDWTVKFRERSGKFEDVVVPDAINIIDFLEIHDNFYLVGQMIRDIFDAMRGGEGIAIIALQKDPKQDTGRGGYLSLEKSRLYLTMDYNKKDRKGTAQIVKAKNFVNTAIDPNGMYISFNFLPGGKFGYSDWKMPC